MIVSRGVYEDTHVSHWADQASSKQQVSETSFTRRSMQHGCNRECVWRFDLIVICASAPQIVPKSWDDVILMFL